MKITKVWVEEDQRLLDVTKDVMQQALGIDKVNLESEAKRIEAISCKDCDLKDPIHHSKSTMERLDSKDTPIHIFRWGLDVILPPIIYEMSCHQ